MLLLTLLQILFLTIQVRCQELFQKREYSFTQPYQQGNWDFYGNTLIASNYVRLTPNEQSKFGGIFITNPVDMRAWEVHLNFKVHGKSGFLFGDGMAFWYINQSLTPGPVFGSHDHFRGLAVFLDTYSNHNGPHNHAHPYISVMVNNGDKSYDHDKDGTHNEVSGCTSYFRNKEYSTHVSIRYVKETLSIFTDVDNKGEWEKCLEINGVKLPTGYFFGVSAATGELSDTHDVLSIKTYEIDSDLSDDGSVDFSQIEPSAEHVAAPRDHMEDNPAPMNWTGFRIFLVIVLILIGTAVCVVVGFLIYAREENKRKRFY